MTPYERVVAKQDELIQKMQEQIDALKKHVEKLQEMHVVKDELILNLEAMVALLKSSNDTLAYNLAFKKELHG